MGNNRFDNEKKTLLLQGSVALFIAIIVNTAVFCFVNVCEIAEIKTFFDELDPLDFGFAGAIQRRKDTPVFAEKVINRSHVIGLFTIKPVVVCRPAMIGSEFFIRASLDRVATFQTGFDFNQGFHG